MPNAKTTNAQPVPPSNKRRRRRRRRAVEQTNLIDPNLFNTLRLGPNQTRSGVSPNPADPRTTILPQNLGNTVLGRMDVLKILHPCGEYNMEVAKIPDGAFSTTSAFERRDEYEIRSPSAGTSETGQPTYTSWSVLIVHVPFLRQRDLVVRWNNLITPSKEQLETIVADLLTATSDYESTSNTITKRFYPSFTTLARIIQGKTTPAFMIGKPASRIPQNILENTEFSFLLPTVLGYDLNVHQGASSSNTSTQALVNTYFRSIRRTACGYTIDLDASDLYNEGRLITGQWSPNVDLSNVRSKEEVMATDSTSTTPKAISVVRNEEPVYVALVPPVTSADIVQTDQYCRQALAKTGSYTPIRPSDPIVPFTPGKETRRIVFRAPNQLDDHYLANEYFDAYNEDVYLAGWSIGVEYYMNLNPTAELRMKVRECLELIPTQGSTYSTFTSPGHPNDYMAQEILKEFCRTQPHSYPADFNDMNKLFSTLFKGLGSVLGTLGIPVLSQVAPILGNSLGDLMDKRSRKKA